MHTYFQRMYFIFLECVCTVSLSDVKYSLFCHSVLYLTTCNKMLGHGYDARYASLRFSIIQNVDPHTRHDTIHWYSRSPTQSTRSAHVIIPHITFPALVGKLVTPILHQLRAQKWHSTARLWLALSWPTTMLGSAYKRAAFTTWPAVGAINDDQHLHWKKNMNRILMDTTSDYIWPIEINRIFLALSGKSFEKKQNLD